MPPNATNHAAECTGVLNEVDAETYDGGLDRNVVEMKRAEKRKLALVWRNIILFAYVHLAAVYGAWLMITSAKLYTVIFGKFNCVAYLFFSKNNWLNLFMFVSLNSCGFILVRWLRNHGRCAQTLGASFVQSAFSITRLARNIQHIGLPRLRHSMGSWSSCSSQIFRNRCWSTQCNSRLLLLTRRMVAVQKTSRSHCQRQRIRSFGLGKWSRLEIPEKVSLKSIWTNVVIKHEFVDVRHEKVTRH